MAAGNGTCAPGLDTGDPTSQPLDQPRGLIRDGSYYYFAEKCRIRRVGGVGSIDEYLTTRVGTGTCGFSGEDTTPLATQVNEGRSPAIDGSGRLIYADKDNHRIRGVDIIDQDNDDDTWLDAFDNCPSLANIGQENADGNFLDQTPPSTQDDWTWVNSDVLGDACDSDDDNDGALDTTEVAGCNGSPALDPIDRDTDNDRFLDGAECVLGTDPTSAGSKPGTSPGGTAACGPTGDTDGDRIADRIEVCGFNSIPTDIDTDDDVKDGQSSGLAKDGCEVASLNSDRVVNAGDQLLMIQEIIREPVPSLRLTNMDLNRDGSVNSGDQLLMNQFISPSGQCP